MTELFNITGHTVHLGIMSGTDIVYLEKIYGHNSAKVRTSVGSRRPAYSTALGKAILAHTHPDEVGSSLPAKLSRITPYTISSEGMIFKAFTRIREEGTATDYEESFHGLSCLAAPIFHTESCAPVAALSLSVPANGRSVLRHRNALLDAARHLSKELGYMPMVSL
ncbi:IclR family transcriptional regulator C-terminal domain-containing protein [Nocardia rhamnosiphila]